MSRARDADRVADRTRREALTLLARWAQVCACRLPGACPLHTQRAAS